MRRKILMLTAVFGLMAGTIAAQQPPASAGRMSGMTMDGGGEEGAMGPLTTQFGKYAPAAVLAMKSHLSLTADQEAKLTALVAAGKQAETAAHHPAHAAHMELRKLQGAEAPDTAAMRRFFLAHHNAEGDMQWVRVAMAIQAKALLTPAQRTMVEQMGGHH